MLFAHFTTKESSRSAVRQEAPKTVENFVGLAEGIKEWTDPRTGQKAPGRTQRHDLPPCDRRVHD
jgi:hypothetical protein